MTKQYEQEQGNKFNEYIGIVVEDKDTYSRTIKVYLEELLPFVQGDIKPILQKKQVDSNADGHVSKVSLSNYVEAKYIGSPNRRYPPDVRAYEQVYVWKYADSEEYYWDSMGRDDNRRGPERLNFSVSGSAGPVDTLTDENTYYIELDTRLKKRIVLKTSKKNGEDYAYTIQLDPNNSRLQICDDSNNEILIDSTVPRVRLRNKSGSILDLADKNGSIIIPQDLLLKAGRQLVLNVPVVTCATENGDGAVLWRAKDLKMELAKSMVIQSPCIGLQGATRTDTIVATDIQAESFSHGSAGSRYSGVQTNVETGTGSNPTNSPNTGGGGASNRHCAAWEETHEAIIKLAECIALLAGECPEHSNIIELANQAKMPRNRGE